MKNLRTLLAILVIGSGSTGKCQEFQPPVTTFWQIGIGLGELPIGGSFKPSITIGYHFNEKLYAGIIYQFRDKISRNEASFNARSTGLESLLSSSETVAQRLLLQVRYTPVKHGPYLSAGVVYNGEDTEKMRFDDRSRNLSGESYTGPLTIQQTRPAGWGVALGLGYQYNFRNGLSAGFEWTPAWGQYPEPFYQFQGPTELSVQGQNELKERMDKGFKGSVTNMYKVFHIGIAYRF
jgi:hypothetical protein